jgi:hypothetical protein
MGPESSRNLDLELALNAACTDLGNGERFVARNAELLLWNGRLGWSWWSGLEWIRDPGELHVTLAAHICARCIRDEAVALRAAERDTIIGHRRGVAIYRSDELAEWAIASEATGRLRAMVTVARPYLTSTLK